MKTWYLVLWLLWPDGTVEKGEIGPLPTLAACVQEKAQELRSASGATVLRAECEEER